MTVNGLGKQSAGAGVAAPGSSWSVQDIETQALKVVQKRVDALRENYAAILKAQSTLFIPCEEKGEIPEDGFDRKYANGMLHQAEEVAIAAAKERSKCADAMFEYFGQELGEDAADVILYPDEPHERTLEQICQLKENPQEARCVIEKYANALKSFSNANAAYCKLENKYKNLKQEKHQIEDLLGDWPLSDPDISKVMKLVLGLLQQQV